MKNRLMKNPYRRESADPKLEIVLQDEAYFPGDTLVGMVRLYLELPFDMVTFEVEVTAVEKAVVGGFLYTATNPEVRRTTYYQQFVTLMGMSHDVLVSNAGIKRASVFFRPAAYLPTRKDAPAAQFRPVDDGKEGNDTAPSPRDDDSGENRDSASRRSTASLYNPSTFGDASGLEVVQLLPGAYTYPFAIPLPATIPPSNRTVHGREAEASLTYTITARLIHKNGKSHFKVARNFDVVALSVQLQRWLLLHRRSGNGMSAEEGKAGMALSRQTSDVGNANTRRSSSTASFSGSGVQNRDEDDEGKVSLRRQLDHTLQFTADELARDEEEFQREERRRRKEKKKRQRAAKQTALTVENVEHLDDDGGVFVESATPVPDGAEQGHDEDGDEERPVDTETAKVRKAAEKEKHMEELLEMQQWEETFTLPLRNSVLKKALVGLHVLLNTVVLARGYSRLCVTSMVDNTQGSSSISRVKYSLITRSRVWSKKEMYKYDTTFLEHIVSDKIEKGRVARVDMVELVIPPEAAVTMITDGCEIRTFLNIRLYVSSPFKTYSRSVDVEVLVANGVDTRNMSRRLRTWSCYFKDKGLGKKTAAPPPCIDLSVHNRDILLLDGTETLLPPSSAVLDGRQQSGLVPNFERATFTPIESFAALRNASSGAEHLDPMASINPFAEDETKGTLQEAQPEPRRSFGVYEEAPSRQYPEEDDIQVLDH